MFDAFFDGSGKSENASDRWLILACLSGGPEACQAFRDHWRALLGRFELDFLHMREATNLNRSIGSADFEALVQGAIGILTFATFGRSKPRLLASVHGVNLDDCRLLLQADPSIRTTPEMLLAFHSLNDIFEWHRADLGSVEADASVRPVRGIRLVFDQGEPFRKFFAQVFRNKKFREHHNRWKLVETISEIDARSEPMLQAADLLAWSFRRCLVVGTSDRLSPLAFDVFKTAKVEKRIFQGEELRVALRSLSGQNERYRKALRPQPAG